MQVPQRVLHAGVHAEGRGDNQAVHTGFPTASLSVPCVPERPLAAGGTTGGPEYAALAAGSLPGWRDRRRSSMVCCMAHLFDPLPPSFQTMPFITLPLTFICHPLQSDLCRWHSAIYFTLTPPPNLHPPSTPSSSPLSLPGAGVHGQVRAHPGRAAAVCGRHG